MIWKFVLFAFYSVLALEAFAAPVNCNHLFDSASPAHHSLESLRLGEKLGEGRENDAYLASSQGALSGVAVLAREISTRGLEDELITKLRSLTTMNWRARMGAQHRWTPEQLNVFRLKEKLEYEVLKVHVRFEFGLRAERTLGEQNPFPREYGLILDESGVAIGRLIEKAQGKSLLSVLANQDLTYPELMTLTSKIRKAVGTLHRNDMGHGDLFAGNIVVNRHNETREIEIKLIDPAPEAFALYGEERDLEQLRRLEQTIEASAR